MPGPAWPPRFSLHYPHLSVSILLLRDQEGREKQVGEYGCGDDKAETMGEDRGGVSWCGVHWDAMVRTHFLFLFLITASDNKSHDNQKTG